jgi:hypothetical protein
MMVSEGGPDKLPGLGSGDGTAVGEQAVRSARMSKAAINVRFFMVIPPVLFVWLDGRNFNLFPFTGNYEKLPNMLAS